LAAISTVLQLGNHVLRKKKFIWKFSSDKPGLVAGSTGTIVRAEPVQLDHGFCDVLIVVGAERQISEDWFKRVRSMQRRGFLSVLLSSAATSYIRSHHSGDARVTTHWKDARMLIDSGFPDDITNTFAEKSGNIITSAGFGSAVDLTLDLIRKHLSTAELAELTNLLLHQHVRGMATRQPQSVTQASPTVAAEVAGAINIMESNLSEPLTISEICSRLGVSSRCLERNFKTHFDLSPGRFYKMLRVNCGYDLIMETSMPLLEIALVTGFSSVASFSNAFKLKYAITPTAMREKGPLTQSRVRG